MKYCMVKELHLLVRAQKFIEQDRSEDRMINENNKQYLEYIEWKRNEIAEKGRLDDCLINNCCENIKMRVCGSHS